MKKNIRLCCITTALLMMLLPLSACSGAASTSAKAADAAAEKPALVIGTAELSGSFDPFFSATLYDVYLQELMFDTLVTVDAEGNPAAALAEYEISEDGLTYTFHIRENARYWDGNPVRAEDFIFALQVYADPAYDGYYDFSMLGIEGYADYQLGAAESISGLSAPDESTLVVQVLEASPTLIYYFTVPAMEKTYYGEGYQKGDLSSVREKLAQPMGTGQYRLTDYRPGESATLVANADYYKGAPSIETVVFSVTPAGMELDRLSLGETDLDFVYPEPDNMARLAEMKGLKSYLYPMNGVTYLVLNNTFAPFDDPAVRQAVARAIPRQPLAEIFYGENAWVADAPVSTASWAWDAAAVGSVDYDLEATAALLADAGYTKNADGNLEKNGQPLSILYSIDPENPVSAALAPILVENCGELGIPVTTENLDFSLIIDRLTDGTLQMFMLGSSLTADPNPADLFSSWGYQNFSGYFSDEADALMTQAYYERDRDTLKSIYTTLWKQLEADMPVIFLYQRNDMWVASERVQNLEFSPFRNFTQTLYLAELAG